ncbi:MAG: hypothetical protein ACYS8W_10135 [Planctomycetota bacterium]|jgi:hypothetical protein
MSRDELIQLTGAIRNLTKEMEGESDLRAELMHLREQEKKLASDAKKSKLKRKAPTRGKRVSRRPRTRSVAKDDGSAEKLAGTRARITELEEKLDVIYSLRDRRRQFVEQRKAFLSNIPAMTCPEITECSEELDRYDIELALVDGDMEKVSAALRELKRAKSLMGRARTQMGKASGAADADVFLGGAVGLGLSLYKHSKMKDANREAGKAGIHIRRANKILKTLTIPTKRIKTHSFQNISAIFTTFFDGWLADGLVADHMSHAHQKMTISGVRLSGKISELNRFRDQLEEEREHILDICEDVEIRRDNALVTAYVQAR